MSNVFDWFPDPDEPDPDPEEPDPEPDELEPDPDELEPEPDDEPELDEGFFVGLTLGVAGPTSVLLQPTR